MRLIDSDLEIAKLMHEIAYCEERIGKWEGRRNDNLNKEIDTIIDDYRRQIREARYEIQNLRNYTEVEIEPEKLSTYIKTKENNNG